MEINVSEGSHEVECVATLRLQFLIASRFIVQSIRGFVWFFFFFKHKLPFSLLFSTNQSLKPVRCFPFFNFVLFSFVLAIYTRVCVCAFIRVNTVIRTKIGKSTEVYFYHTLKKSRHDQSGLH